MELKSHPYPEYIKTSGGHVTHFSYEQESILTPETFPYAYSTNFSLTIKISRKVNTPLVVCINRVQIIHAVTHKKYFLFIASIHTPTRLLTYTNIHPSSIHISNHPSSVRLSVHSLILLFLSFLTSHAYQAPYKSLTIYIVIN
jgi:hypothetical protein